MNEKAAKKLRKFAKRHVYDELKGFQKLSLRERIKIAFRIIFKR
jgi:hypothetical protein